MTYDRVPLEYIDLEDQRYRISERLESSRLLESLRQIGQLSPVCLQARKGSRLAVICGFRRVQALRSLGQRDVLARIWHEGEQSDLELFRIALWDNLSHRELSPLERARVLTSLKNLCDVQHDQLVEIYLPVLGMEPHKNTLRTYLALHALDPQLRETLNDGRITLASAERLSRAPLSFQNQMSEVLERVRWSASLQRETLDLVEELAAIAGSDPGAILAGKRISGIVARCDSFAVSEEGNGFTDSFTGGEIRDSAGRRNDSWRTEKELRELPPHYPRCRLTPLFRVARLRVEFSARSTPGFHERDGKTLLGARGRKEDGKPSSMPIADCRLQIGL